MLILEHPARVSSRNGRQNLKIPKTPYADPLIPHGVKNATFNITKLFIIAGKYKNTKFKHEDSVIIFGGTSINLQTLIATTAHKSAEELFFDVSMVKESTFPQSDSYERRDFSR